VTNSLSAGQRQALDELTHIETCGGPAVVHVDGITASGELPVDVVFDCASVTTADNGLRLRRWERLRVFIPPRFPFDLPRVETPHARWAKTAHVQFGSHVCLYRSKSVEWNPSDGMFGFVERVIWWLERAAAGQLDAVGEPMHPPVAYDLVGGGGALVVRASAPRVAAGDAPWLGIAILRRTGESFSDVVGWHRLGEGGLSDAVRAVGGAPVPVFCAAAVVLPDPIGFEFPFGAAALTRALARQGLSQRMLLGLVGLSAIVNDTQQRYPPVGPALTEPFPLYALIGTPSRGIVGSETVTHLAAWRLPGDATPLLTAVTDQIAESSDDAEAEAAGEAVLAKARGWVDETRVHWTTVYEMRPEATIRRDDGSTSSWLAGRQVLVLGAGALGAPITEACVRAGAAQVVVADSGYVHPGILVRQPYDEADIGKAKATVLAERLSRIRSNLDVTPHVGDVTNTLFGPTSGIPACDLIIDATADRIVRHVVETCRRVHRLDWPAQIAVMIGHDARRGVAAVSLPGTSGGALDVLRRLGLTARADVSGRLADVVDDFYPDPARHDLFQPEPGCSDATFRGGAADVGALAGELLAGSLGLLREHAEGRTAQGMHALVVRLAEPSAARAGVGPQLVSWSDDVVLPDHSGRYEVRIAATALAEIRAECRRGLRVRARKIETGGLLLGQYDDAAGIVWVDIATGPPPDSFLSADHFEHGTAGVSAIVKSRLELTARTSGFVGMWHSHPDGVAWPSETDKQGMGALVAPVEGGPRRALLLVAGSIGQAWTDWLEGETAEPDLYAHVVDRRERDGAATTLQKIVVGSAGSVWPGGYLAGAAVASSPDLRRRRRFAIPIAWLRSSAGRR
jgi:proteasome lid subunit RPN8/RPN11